jgi:hypothetical protein
MRKLLTLSLFAVLACAQTAKYPSSIVTDGDLGVASNLANTTLAAGITPSATSFTVRSAAGIAANVFLTLSNAEIVKVCGVTGTTIQVGDSSCPNIDGRGFDGTTATYHSSGGAVRSYPISKNHNQLAAEVKAIQNTLGVNLSNVPGFNAPYKLATTYNFTPQSPGGSLIAGANSITMTPVPAGVNGSDTDHYLYVSGGVGAAEACLIIGGSGVAGDASGQIIIQCAGPHSGAWTVGPVAGGIQEGVCALPAAGGEVVVTSDVTLYANVGWCGKTTVSVRKQPGATITGAYTVLGSMPSYAGNETWFGTISYTPYIDQALGPGGMTIYPTLTSAGNRGMAYALQVQQSDPTKITSPTFFNGIGVDVHANTPKWYVEGVTSNQNAAFLGFMHSYKGADVFGGDFHAIVPATATAAPNYMVGAQLTLEINGDFPDYGQRIGALITSSSTVTPKIPATVGVYFGGDGGFNYLMANEQAAFTNEGILLWPAATVSADKSAYAVLNAAATARPWFVDIAGRQVTQSLRVGSTAGVVTQVTGNGAIHFTGNTARIFDTYRTPATSAEACFAGELSFSATYLYICAADNTWKRLLLEAF